MGSSPKARCNDIVTTNPHSDFLRGLWVLSSTGQVVLRMGWKLMHSYYIACTWILKLYTSWTRHIWWYSFGSGVSCQLYDCRTMDLQPSWHAINLYKFEYVIASTMPSSNAQSQSTDPSINKPSPTTLLVLQSGQYLFINPNSLCLPKIPSKKVASFVS